MRFMLDENVPRAVAELLLKRGYTAEFIRDFAFPGAIDTTVATIAEQRNSILISFDGDFERIAPRIPLGQRRRFKSLSRIWLRCEEHNAAIRINAVLSFIETEYETAQNSPRNRMLLWIGKSYLTTHR
ncbi:DUF5615 family PIN-like protein [Nisaea sp.]|uniref:DUF5615 family PIN-like protein n=1 Tax=Nisaea sp. TaxID=2024842 RepID=UPI0032EAC5CC